MADRAIRLDGLTVGAALLGVLSLPLIAAEVIEQPARMTIKNRCEPTQPEIVAWVLAFLPWTVLGLWAARTRLDSAGYARGWRQSLLFWVLSWTAVITLNVLNLGLLIGLNRELPPEWTTGTRLFALFDLLPILVVWGIGERAQHGSQRPIVALLFVWAAFWTAYLVAGSICNPVSTSVPSLLGCSLLTTSWMFAAYHALSSGPNHPLFEKPWRTGVGICMLVIVPAIALAMLDVGAVIAVGWAMSGRLR